jgi:hypothetical protein
MQLKFSIVKDHDEPTILLFETLFCMWECFNMGTELPTKFMLGQTMVLIQMPFLNNVRKVGRLVLSRTSCRFYTPPLGQDGIKETVKTAECSYIVEYTGIHSNDDQTNYK